MQNIIKDEISYSKTRNIGENEEEIPKPEIHRAVRPPAQLGAGKGEGVLVEPHTVEHGPAEQGGGALQVRQAPSAGEAHRLEEEVVRRDGLQCGPGALGVHPGL